MTTRNDKIDVIVPFLLPPFLGGTETVLKTLYDLSDEEMGLRYILPFAVKDHPLLPVFDGKNTEQIITPIRFKNLTLVKLWGIVYLLFFMLRPSTKYVVILSPKYIKYASMINKVRRRKLVIISWLHFSLTHEFTDVKEIFLLADYHLAISTGIKRQLVEIGVPEQRIFVIYNPIFKKEKTILHPETAEFVYTGRMQIGHQKNLGELIEALTLIGEANWHFTFIGDGIDMNAIQTKVHENGLQDKITFVGWVKDPWGEMPAISASILTSKYEGLPMALLEAISYGVPVIAPDIPTGPEDVISPDNGYLYEAGNVRQLANDMLDLIDNPDKFVPLKVKESIQKFYISAYYDTLQAAWTVIRRDEE